VKPISILELEFDTFFGSIGFRRVSEFVGESPAFKNADYICQAKKIVVELKILDKDFFKDGGVIDRFHSIIPIPKQIDERGFGIYSIKIPNFNREGKIDSIEEPLRRIIKKANRQIKETNRNLLSNDGKGILVLALSGFLSLSLDILVAMISELLTHEFSSISGFIVCTPTLNSPSCISASNEIIGSQIHVIRREISEAWCNFFDQGGHGSAN